MWKSSHEEGGKKKSERENYSMLNNLNIVIGIRQILVSSDPIMTFICVWLIFNSMLAVAQLI